MTLIRMALTGYRCFAQRQLVELRPITVVLGKNNSGKSALTRAPVVFNTGIRTDSPAPLDLDTLSDDILESFTDLVYGNRPHGSITIELEFEEGKQHTNLAATIQNIDEYSTQVVSRLDLGSNGSLVRLEWEPTEPPDRAIYSISSGDAIYNGIYHEFEGLLPVGRVGSSVPGTLVEHIGQVVEAARRDYPLIRYLGPFRDRPQRRYRLPVRMPADIGVSGGFAAGILASDFARHNGRLLRQVNAELRQSLPGWRVSVVERGGLYSVVLTSDADTSVTVNLADAGTGVAQVLPIIVQRAVDKQLGMDAQVLEIIEQPELHLHPAAHAALADMYLSAQNNGLRFIIETHSETFLLRLRRRIAEGLDPSTVGVYFVEQSDGSSDVHKITIDENGNLDRWPEGVFSEDYEETKGLVSAQLSRGSKSAR